MKLRPSKKLILRGVQWLQDLGYPIDVEIAYGGYKFEQTFLSGTSSDRLSSSGVRDLSGRLTAAEAMIWLDGFQAANALAGKRKKGSR